MNPVFTRHDAWNGGSIDTLMFFGDASPEHAINIAEALWSFPKLDGPYRCRNVEPDQQERADYSAFINDGFEQLIGVLTHHDGSRSPLVHTTLMDDNGLWVYVGLTVGGLPASWKIGAYPFDDGFPTSWLEPLVDDLRNISNHVHQYCPIRGALYGWIDAPDWDLLLNAISGKIPKERWHGLSIWQGNECDYFPPTMLGPHFKITPQ